jgi:spore coat polysaccharide biosynthesis protein SpsF (cytidylyltransferase family)
MLLPLNGHPLIWWAWRRSIEAFGEANVVVCIPATEENQPLKDFLLRPGINAQVFEWEGPEEDVLGRLYYAANTYRWHPHSVICRVTPDDPRKEPGLMQAVAIGARHPVEQSCEAVTLEYLSVLHHNVTDPMDREHLTRILSPVPPPPAPEGIWTVDTQEDLEAIAKEMGR